MLIQVSLRYTPTVFQTPECSQNVEENKTEPPSWPPSCPVAVNLSGVCEEFTLKGEIV